jgi:RNA polymerase sigma-70 factor (ECF subfamily)
MTIAPSFDHLIARLREGDDEAAEEIFRRFAHRLVLLARSRLDRRVQGKLDPEDVLQSVFRSFFVRLADGQFDLKDWDNLWSLLVRITLRKCGRQIAALRVARRDYRRELTPLGSTVSSRDGWEGLAREPDPEEAATLADTVEWVLKGLDAKQQEIVVLRLQGHLVSEISQTVGRTERTVHRVLAHVRNALQRLEDDPTK